MTAAERLERIEHIAANTAANLDKLSQVTATIAASAPAHDDQIDKLIQAAEINRQE
jgi:hypothetical protein